MKGDETENKKIGCTVNLLNFYKSEINKEEMYIRYIHKLCDMHLQAENYTVCKDGFNLFPASALITSIFALLSAAWNRTQLFGPYPSLLEKIEQETWRETGISFVTSVTRLMERLLDYRDCMKGDETENKKIGCTVNLLNFYKSEINKEEMYIRYIHKLCDMHLQAENYTEAAFTLLLYWELLHWEDRPLREFLHYPTQSEWQRKEGLCRKVIHYFNKGKCWEYGIPLCRELASQYEALYDYQSLSWIRKMEAAYYDNIMEQQRLEPEFFRVGFYGRKFPFFLRNKEFVCRGHDYERLEAFQQRMLAEFPQAIAMQERLEAFQQRMLAEFPQAIAMQHPNQPDETILQCDAQCILHCATPTVDAVILLHRSLWIERTTLILTRPLPGISRWFEVEKREVVEVSPLENGIYVVENKNHELRTLICQYQHKQLHGNINLLSMCLNGMIDAAVNGGIARYQEAFFDKDYITSHPEDAEKITQLKELMQEQVHILGVGLAVHEKLVHPEMRPLHKKLIDQFQMMRSSLCHGLPGLEKISPACSGTSTPRGSILASHSPLSPESIKLVHRHSPLNLLGSIRHSSSSLSSHTSSETGNHVILTDGLVGETSEDIFRMQMINSAPSSARDKYRHNREMIMLLPPHRERPSSAMYPAMTENGQPTNFQRALIQQVIGPCKPCSDPNLSVVEKAVPTAPSSWSLDSGTREAMPFLSAHVGSIMVPPVPPRTIPHGHFSMHFDAFHHQISDLPPALPARSLRKSPLHPIPASPTSPHSGLDGSSSTLSGSASSGVSSLSESNFGHSCEPPVHTDTMDSVPSQSWTIDEDVESPYLPVRYSISEPDVLEPMKPPPCRSHSAPSGVNPHHDPPTLPPKPYMGRGEGCIPEEEMRPRPMPRKISQPLLSCKEEQAKVAWEHGIKEE
ncbi:UNVERIFIED_CONTAM: hypothetical protein FKN15_051225 [Acipenser sinensis]